MKRFVFATALFAAALGFCNYKAQADVPVQSASGSVTATGTTQPISLVGQSGCTVILGGSATGVTVQFQASGNFPTDSTVSFVTVPLGGFTQATALTTYTGQVANYRQFELNVTAIASGTLNYWYSCDGSVPSTAYAFNSNGPVPLFQCDQFQVINLSASGTIITAPGAGLHTRVCGLSFSLTGTSPTAQAVAGTGAACPTAQSIKTGTYAPTSGSVITLGSNTGQIFSTAVNVNTCLLLGGTTPSAQGIVWFMTTAF